MKCSVIDTGIGMSAPACEGLFKPFCQCEDREGLNKMGCGLGLAVSRSLAELLGGCISVKSAPGLGSKFTFFIATNLDAGPDTYTRMLSRQTRDTRSKNSISVTASACDHQPTTERLSPTLCPTTAVRRANCQQTHPLIMPEDSDRDSPIKCNCPQVLIVDDTPLNIYALKQQLAKLGVATEEAENGKEAIKKAADAAQRPCCRGYKLILMDCCMPVMSGFEATREIMHMVVAEEIRNVKIVGVSGYSAEEPEIKLCIEAGMSETLCKPVGIAKLEQMLERYGLATRRQDGLAKPSA